MGVLEGILVVEGKVLDASGKAIYTSPSSPNERRPLVRERNVLYILLEEPLERYSPKTIETFVGFRPKLKTKPLIVPRELINEILTDPARAKKYDFEKLEREIREKELKAWAEDRRRRGLNPYLHY